jgi:hypothetical protein
MGVRISWTYRNARKKTSFGKAEKDACDKKTRVILDNTHQRHHDTPSDHNCRKPNARSELLEEEVGGDFEGGVCEEEDGKAPVVLIGSHVEIFLEAFDLCISDVSS